MRLFLIYLLILIRAIPQYLSGFGGKGKGERGRGKGEREGGRGKGKGERKDLSFPFNLLIIKNYELLQ